jgi:hypothetical protein
MNANLSFARSHARSITGLGLAGALAALLAAASSSAAEHGVAQRGGGGRSAPVNRSSYGSVRHAAPQPVQRPAEFRPGPARPAEPGRPAPPGRGLPGRGLPGHGGEEFGVRPHRFWHDFAFHHRVTVLPVGYFSFQFGGVPYCYWDGIYYQPFDGGYQEVYPPVGAVIPELPEGAIEVTLGVMIYYYAGGAFYMQQPDGTFIMVAPPIGIVVPELPPGAVQVMVNGAVAYQFNGTYYEPVFLNGVTQYEVFAP